MGESSSVQEVKSKVSARVKFCESIRNVELKSQVRTDIVLFVLALWLVCTTNLAYGAM